MKTFAIIVISGITLILLALPFVGWACVPFGIFTLLNVIFNE